MHAIDQGPNELDDASLLRGRLSVGMAKVVGIETATRIDDFDDAHLVIEAGDHLIFIAGRRVIEHVGADDAPIVVRDVREGRSTVHVAERVDAVDIRAELRIDRPHVARLESRLANLEGRGAVPIRALVRNALRMRPDRLVVGEVRGGEALDMLQAMNTGHDGSLTTVHANSPADALRPANFS